VKSNAESKYVVYELSHAQRWRKERKREDFSLDSLLEDSSRRRKRKGSRLQTPDSRPLRLVQQKRFFFMKKPL
jgi:hypothetical protein